MISPVSSSPCWLAYLSQATPLDSPLPHAYGRVRDCGCDRGHGCARGHLFLSRSQLSIKSYKNYNWDIQFRWCGWVIRNACVCTRAAWGEGGEEEQKEVPDYQSLLELTPEPYPQFVWSGTVPLKKLQDLSSPCMANNKRKLLRRYCSSNSM